MSNSFIYDIPTKIYFGPDMLKNLSKELQVYGKNVLLCYGSGSIKKSGLYDEIKNILADFNIYELKNILPNPRVDSAREAQEIYKEHPFDIILAVGGGSVIDLAKLASAAVFYDGDPWDIVIRKVKPIKCLPIISVLTLAATGSEMDNGGVITNESTLEKLGMGSPLMLPKVSFLNPELTYTVSKYQTACGSADIFSHILETYFVPKEQSMFMLDKVKEGLMKTVIKYAPIAIKDPSNYEARENLMWASSWAINGFTDSKQECNWSCHPLEHELSAFYDITHGLGLAIITPRWMKYVLNKDTLWRFRQYGENVFDLDKNLSDMDIANLAIKKTEEFLYDKLGITSNLKALNIDETHIDEMASHATKGKVINGFVKLTKEDCKNILLNCLE